MTQTNFQFSTWGNAITLPERIELFHSFKRKIMNVDMNVNFAKQYIRRWQSQSPFDTDSYFTQRLLMDGITQDELLHILGIRIEAIHDCFTKPPSWLTKITQAFSHPVSPNPIHTPKMFHTQETIGFLNVIEPLISQACGQLREKIQILIQAQSNLPFDPNTVVDILLTNLLEPLLVMLSRTMVLELNVARLQGLLDGNTSEERFKSFLQRIRQRNIARSILQEYPVLARQLINHIDKWVNSSMEFLQHLCADWNAIQTTFSPENDPGVLLHLYGGAGDTHREGRSVMIAEFNSGFKIVYKPRSMSVDIHFQQLLAWLNEHCAPLQFLTVKVLDRDTYGWMKFVPYKACNSTVELHRFYERIGGYLALLYALEATDFHCENLIASGENPVLIDLESLFHPRLDQNDTEQSELLAVNIMLHSVMRIGLLPTRAYPKVDFEGIDISGLGAWAGQLAPDRFLYAERVGTDEMRYIRKQQKMQRGHNRPIFNGSDVNIIDHTEAIINGFTIIYRLFMKHRDELLFDNGFLDRFAGDEVRVIIRDTRTYSLLLYESFHPDLLHNALDRDIFFNKLWIAIEDYSYLPRIIPAEREDLYRGDIPIFTTYPSSRDLWSSSGKRIANFFDESVITMVQRRLHQLNEEDLTKNIFFIRSSIATISEATHKMQRSKLSVTKLNAICDHEQRNKRLLTAAQAVGNRLEACALRGKNDVCWIGLTFTGEGLLSLAPLNIDLYSGIPGVALFLGYLGAITKDDKYTSLAKAAMTTMRRLIERNKSDVKSIGAFAGWGGIIYTLAHLGALWHQPALLVEAKDLTKILPHLIDEDTHFDIIAGTAGCILSLISLYHTTLSDDTLAIAVQCGDHLIANAKPMQHGVGWSTISKIPSCGFAHGAAGISCALLELTSLSGKNRFRTAALAAIDYERSLLSPEVGNWPTWVESKTSGQAVRNDQVNEIFSTKWCHGAPGIGLSRLCALRHIDDTEIHAEIQIALKTTLDHGFGYNHSLCHGDLGNLDFLLYASEILKDSRLLFEVNRNADIVLETINKYGWISGVALQVETFGLMVGLAGIGYELLRLAAPKRVPSVLVLAPPDITPRS